MIVMSQICTLAEMGTNTACQNASSTLCTSTYAFVCTQQNKHVHALNGRQSWWRAGCHFQDVLASHFLMDLDYCYTKQMASTLHISQISIWRYTQGQFHYIRCDYWTLCHGKWHLKWGWDDVQLSERSLPRIVQHSLSWYFAFCFYKSQIKSNSPGQCWSPPKAQTWESIDRPRPTTYSSSWDFSRACCFQHSLSNRAQLPHGNSFIRMFMYGYSISLWWCSCCAARQCKQWVFPSLLSDRLTNSS